MKRILEVCVESLAGARAAIAGGADRLELCSALCVGGLTPSAALLRLIRAESGIPIRCMIRPRAGDFCYTRDELTLMAAQMRELAAAGADGFVLGALTPQGELDVDALTPLLAAADGRGTTLHRCIDHARDPLACYRAACALDFDTVLTSGTAASCLDGVETIAALDALRQELSGAQLLIGAGVNAEAITTLLRQIPTLDAFHMSGKKAVASAMRFHRENVPMGTSPEDAFLWQTDADAIRRAAHALAK